MAITHRHPHLEFKLQPQGQHLHAHDLWPEPDMASASSSHPLLPGLSMCHLDSLHCHDSSRCPCPSNALHTVLMAGYLS